MAEELKDPMDFIWERIPKTPDGEHIRYYKQDIPYLYYKGFVDTTRFALDEWKKAFEPFHQQDGSYLFDLAQFRTLGRYRYVGPVYRPFDAMKVREGEWTHEQIMRLYHLSIKPSTVVTEPQFIKLVEYFNNMPEHRAANGNFVVDGKIKRQLAQLVTMNPSPRRVLEQEVERIRLQREVELRHSQSERGSSKFTLGKTTGEFKREEFAKLQSTSQATTPTPSVQDKKKPAVDLKSLRKGSRGRQGGGII